MKHLRREALEKQPIDDQYMRKLVSRTVKESAADFWYEIRVARPNITWEEIQDVFWERFANYVDAQIALQKLSKLKQDHQQTLHSFCYGHKINLPRFNDLLISEARNQQQRQEYV